MGFRPLFGLLLPLLLAGQLLAAQNGGTLPCQGVRCLGSQEAFSRLAIDLAPRVNLFEEVWRQDPGAVLLHGVVRDYLYWIKTRFKNVHSPEEAKQVEAELRRLPTIDAVEFVDKGGASDIDVASSRGVSIAKGQWGIRRTDTKAISEGGALGSDEVLQGWLPIEKLALTRSRLSSSLGDGVADIYQGRISANFPSQADFARTLRAQDKTNHPVLLAIRYLRGLIQNQLSEPAGAAVSDPALDEKVKRIIHSAVLKPELESYKDSKIFWVWLNSGIQKLLRKEKDPTPQLELLKQFGVLDLTRAYPEKLSPLNTVVHTVSSDPGAVSRNLSRYGLNESALYLSGKDAYPGGLVYHGTKDESAFRSILLDGPIAGRNGYLWVSSEFNVDYSENFREKEHLIRFSASPEARLIDLNSTEGQRAWTASKPVHKGNYSTFMELFGADGLRLEAGPGNFSASVASRSRGRDAHYIIRNAGVLEKPEGVHKTVLSFSALLERVRQTRPEGLKNLLTELARQALSPTEEARVLEELLHSPGFPPLDRLMKGKAFFDQVEGIISIMESLDESYGKTLTPIGARLKQTLATALAYKGDKPGLAHEISKAAAALDSAQAVRKYLSIIPRQWNYNIWHETADRLVRDPAQAWKASRILTDPLEKTGDVGAMIRLLDYKGCSILQDDKEIAAIASRSFDKALSRTLPASNDAVAALKDRNYASVTGDEAIEFILGYARRTDVSEESRQKLLSAVRKALADLPRVHEGFVSRQGYVPEPPEFIRSALFAEFMKLPEAVRLPRLMAQWSIHVSDKETVLRMLAEPSLRQTLASELAIKSWDSVSFLTKLGIELPLDQEHDFLQAAQARGANGFLDYRARQSLGTPWFERLSRHPDLMASPETPEFFRNHLKVIREEYEHLPRENSSRLGSYISHTYIEQTFKRLEALLAAARQLPGNDDYLSLVREVAASSWNRDSMGGEHWYIRRILQTAAKELERRGPSLEGPAVVKSKVLAGIIDMATNVEPSSETLSRLDESRRLDRQLTSVLSRTQTRKALDLLDTDPAAAEIALHEEPASILTRRPAKTAPATNTSWTESCRSYFGSLVSGLRRR